MSLGILNQKAISCAKLGMNPYGWALVEPTFSSPAIACSLRECFPTDGYDQFSRRSGQKRHNLYGRQLIWQSAICAANRQLNKKWWRLAEELLSDDYRRA